MARKPMVTRCITTTKVDVLCVNTLTAETFTKTVTLPRTYKDEKKLMKQLEAVINNDGIKAVHPIHTEEVETLYGMSEQTFIDNAVVLDKDTRKELAPTEE